MPRSSNGSNGESSNGSNGCSLAASRSNPVEHSFFFGSLKPAAQSGTPRIFGGGGLIPSFYSDDEMCGNEEEEEEEEEEGPLRLYEPVCDGESTGSFFFLILLPILLLQYLHRIYKQCSDPQTSELNPQPSPPTPVHACSLHPAGHSSTSVDKDNGRDDDTGMDDEWEKVPSFGLCQTATTREVWDSCSVTSAQDDWEDEWETGLVY